MPTGNAFEQGAAGVCRLVTAAGKDVIQVQVRIDIGRNDQPALEVDHLIGFRQIGADLPDLALLDQNLAGAVLAFVDAGIGELFHEYSPYRFQTVLRPSPRCVWTGSPRWWRG